MLTKRISQTQTQAAREKADRMLMLELTDGTTVVEGMEYRPAPNLSVNLSPGTKVRLPFLSLQALYTPCMIDSVPRVYLPYSDSMQYHNKSY